ncbi:MAG: four helix bundle protein [bacterium]
MSNENLKLRTKQFALRVIRMFENMPETKTSKIIGNQLLRSGTSIGANYRAVCFAKSKRDFVNKLKMVEEEVDETLYWLELIEETGIFQKEKIVSIKAEASELMSIVVASIRTARKNLKTTIKP